MSKLRRNVSRNSEMHKERRRKDNKQGRRGMLREQRRSNKMMLDPRSLPLEMLLAKLRMKQLKEERVLKVRMQRDNNLGKAIRLIRKMLL
jgi:hypothetical protein